jgi:hypothetical protein
MALWIASFPIGGQVFPIAVQQSSSYERRIRLDPVKARVALPAADPPDN